MAHVDLTAKQQSDRVRCEFRAEVQRVDSKIEQVKDELHSLHDKMDQMISAIITRKE